MVAVSFRELKSDLHLLSTGTLLNKESLRSLSCTVVQIDETKYNVRYLHRITHLKSACSLLCIVHEGERLFYESNELMSQM